MRAGYLVIHSDNLRSMTLDKLMVMEKSATLPAVVVTVVGYAAVAGGVLSAVSQVTVDDDAKLEKRIVNRLQEDNKNLPRDGIK